MFESEKKGLETIASTQTISVPTIHHCGVHNEYAFLILNFIDSRKGSHDDFKLLGQQLAALHKTSYSIFGFEEDNFIGSLDQPNKMHDTWKDFYIRQRLQPQLELALSKNLLEAQEIPHYDHMSIVLEPLFAASQASLLHGDLWNGNYIFGVDDTPYLIDPAVYYGHHEVDLAMTKLFGGFDQAFYDAYHQVIPINSISASREEIYQLYYLLVHLNLFGSSYYPAVKNILIKYF